MAQEVRRIRKRRRTAFRTGNRQGFHGYRGRKIRRARNESARRPGSEDRRSRCSDRRFEKDVGTGQGRKTEKERARNKEERNRAKGKGGCVRERGPRQAGGRRGRCTCPAGLFAPGY